MQTGQRFGAAHVIAVARGDATDRVLQFSHDRLEAFGTGRDFAKPYMQALIRQAIAARLLSVDISRYGALTLEAGAMDVLEGRAVFECKELAMGPTKRAAKKARKAVQETALNADEERLLAALKALRTQLAREIRKPAYVVFSDATLMDMVAKTPRNEDEMLAVSGVGPTKFERYGEAFLEAIAGA